jgi:hypothetical protein
MLQDRNSGPAGEAFSEKEGAPGSGGHTHHPQVCLLGSDPESHRFYVNTAHGENRIPATPDHRTFGRLRALTCLMLFSSSEDRKEGKNNTSGTFDYWTGYTRHWRRRG